MGRSDNKRRPPRVEPGSLPDYARSLPISLLRAREALMLGFAAENDARMQAMLRARSNVSHVIDDLKRGYHQARQEQMTAEILELSESF